MLQVAGYRLHLTTAPARRFVWTGHLPLDLVPDAAVLDGDGQVAALVEAAELGVGRVGADGHRTALGNLHWLDAREGLG